MDDLEREALAQIAASPELHDDMVRLKQARLDPFRVDGVVDADRVLAFLCGYNDFINHAPKPFRRIADHCMKL